MTMREKKNEKTSKTKSMHNAIRGCGVRRILEGSLLLFFVVIAGCMAVMVREYISGTRAQDMAVKDQPSACMTVSGDPEGGTESSSDAGCGTKSESSSLEGGISSVETANDPEGNSGSDSTSTDSMAYIPLAVEPSKTMETIEYTISFIAQRIPFLQQAMQSSGYCFSEKLLDENTGTTAFILAKNENCAKNLNAYFYYLFDTKPVSSVISPFVLNISTLFEQEKRETAVADGTFAQKELLAALKESLISVLGPCYNEEIFTFIYSEYVRTFAERLNGDPLQTSVCKLVSDHIEIVFHNSFLTYIEFFINP